MEGLIWFEMLVCEDDSDCFTLGMISYLRHSCYQNFLSQREKLGYEKEIKSHLRKEKKKDNKTLSQNYHKLIPRLLLEPMNEAFT